MKLLTIEQVLNAKDFNELLNSKQKNWGVHMRHGIINGNSVHITSHGMMIIEDVESLSKMHYKYFCTVNKKCHGESTISFKDAIAKAVEQHNNRTNSWLYRIFRI